MSPLTQGLNYRSACDDKLTAADHVNALLSSSSSLLYAMRVLHTHGTPTMSLHDIFHATTVARIQYAVPAWSAMCSAADCTHHDSLLRRAKWLGYSSNDVPAIADLFNSADDNFFHHVNPLTTYVPPLLEHAVLAILTITVYFQFLAQITVIVHFTKNV